MDLLSTGANVASILTAVALSIVGLRRWRRNRLIPFDTARTWRSTLHTVNYIFDTSRSQGGSQSHPWTVHDAIYTETQIQHMLDEIAQTRDRRLARSIGQLKAIIRELFAACRAPRPRIYYLEQETTQEERDDWAAVEKYRAQQLEIAERGAQQVLRAIARVNKRSIRH